MATQAGKVQRDKTPGKSLALALDSLAIKHTGPGIGIDLEDMRAYVGAIFSRAVADFVALSI